MAKPSIKKPDEKKMDPELQGIIIGPRITEKAAYAADKNAYVFNVATTANKIQIARAIKTLYNVTPVKVNVSVMKPSLITVRGNYARTKRSKKATVYLPKGQKIELA